MTTLNDFISEVKSGGLAKQNRFMVSFITPNTLVASNADLNRVMMFCESVPLPGVTIASSPTRTIGEVIESPYDRLFDNIAMTFYVDTNMLVKKFFDDWILSIQNPVTKDFEYYSNYITNIKIAMIDGYKNGEETTPYIVTLKECYPKAISPVNLAYSQQGIMTITVTMNLKSWSSEILYPSAAENKDKTKSFLSGSFTSMVRDFLGFQNSLNEARNIFTTLGSSTFIEPGVVLNRIGAKQAMYSIINKTAA